ncbi:MAG: dicarboxylate/amino acid:cation symporter [Bacteroidota bacterium]|jgi:aerobic C4-dicarboxylate transport protein
MADVSEVAQRDHKPIYYSLYFQVIVGISLGIILGFFVPDFAAQLKPLGDAFIKLIKMMIAPIIFGTVAVGIAKMGDLKEVGRVGLKALIYFEALTTVALLIGLVIANLYRPGAGINADPASFDTKAIQAYTTQAQHLNTVDYLMHIIPNTAVGAFAEGEIVQVLLFAVLFGLALSQFGEKGRTLVKVLDEATHVLFRIIGIIMRLAPIGAFGAMAFTIGKYGIGTLLSLGHLMLSVYATCLLFVFVVLNLIAWWCGFSLWKFLKYIKEELLIVLGTSSSESVLPRLMSKMENLGCAKPVVGLVVPTGYSFNLDGTCIYLTMAAIFLAQATNTELSWGQQLGIIGILLLTSKGAAGVTGSGFIVLAATLASVGTIPVASIALIIGVDRFMSEARALTNLVGNSVATVVIAKWEGALDTARMQRVLKGETVVDAEAPELALDTELPADVYPEPVRVPSAGR